MVWVDDAEINLSYLELRLLVTLYDRRERVQSRERLLDSDWLKKPIDAKRSYGKSVFLLNRIIYRHKQ